MNTNEPARDSSRAPKHDAARRHQQHVYYQHQTTLEHSATPEESAQPPCSLPRTTFTHSAISLLTAFTYSAITLAAMTYGIITATLPLIYLACGLAAASQSPALLGLLPRLAKWSATPQKANQDRR